MTVVIATEVRLIVIHARVSLRTEAAIERLQGFAGGSGLRRGQCLVSLGKRTENQGFVEAERRTRIALTGGMFVELR